MKISTSLIVTGSVITILSILTVFFNTYHSKQSAQVNTAKISTDKEVNNFERR